MLLNMISVMSSHYKTLEQKVLLLEKKGRYGEDRPLLSLTQPGMNSLAASKYPKWFNFII